MITPRVVYGSSVYAALCAVILLIRPSFAFDRAGNPRAFGLVDPDASVFSMGLLSPVAALFSFVLASVTSKGF